MKIKRKIAKAVLLGMAVMSNCVVCFAEETTEGGTADEVATEIINPLNALLGIMVAGAEVIGGFIIYKGIVEFNTAWKASDDAGTANAIKTIISGILFAVVGIILGIFGIKV